MGYPTKVQFIKRKASEQWYINLPAAVAQAMEFKRGETVEWVIENKSQLILRRASSDSWAEAARRIAQAGDDKLLMGEFDNAEDRD